MLKEPVVAPPAHIELTPEWQQTLYRYCFATDFLWQQSQATQASLSYVTPKQQGLWRRLHPLTNYYVTLARPSHDCSSATFEQLVAQMLAQPWHIAEWGPMDQDDPFATTLIAYLKQAGLPLVIEPAFTNWQLHLEQSAESYFAQRPSKLKSTLKRKSRALAKQFASIDYKLITTTAELTHYFPDYLEVYQNSWKPTEGSIEFIEQFCRLAAERGWLRLGLLFVDNRAIAAQIWFVYQGSATIFKLAYRASEQKYSPGTLLTEWLMRQVLEQEQIRHVDFGMGDEPYKADWMSSKNRRYSITTFNTRCLSGRLAQLRYQWLPALKQRLLHHD